MGRACPGATIEIMVRQAMVSWAVCIAAAGCSKPAPERPAPRGLAWDSLIEGKVVDDVSGEILAGTTVSASGGGLAGESLRTVTGPDGGFSFGPVPAGRYSLTVMYKDLVVQRWIIVGPRVGWGV
jgi:hypothetical protein